MKNYGIELEFFVAKTNIDNRPVIPAYLATSNLDGNPFIGELRTGIHNNILDAVFELKKLIYMETERLKAKGFSMLLIPEATTSNEVLINMRKDSKAVELKELAALEEFSIYPKGRVGKLLKRGQFKASLQINISDNSIVSTHYTDENKQRQKFESPTSNIFNFIPIISKLDSAFAQEISYTTRVKGVFAVKQGKLGQRIEYRSLPNSIDIDKLLTII